MNRCKNSCQKTEEDYIEEHVVIQLNAQELQLDEKALKEIMSAPKEGNKGGEAGNPEKKKKKKKKNKKKPAAQQPVEESKGSDDEEEDVDSEAEEERILEKAKAKEGKIPEAPQDEEDAHSESDWM